MLESVSIAVFESAKQSTRNSVDIVDKLKKFLAENAKDLHKGNVYRITAKDVTGETSVHYYALKKAFSPTLSKGAKRGMANPAFDVELAKAFDIAFPPEAKQENARVASFLLKVLK